MRIYWKISKFKWIIALLILVAIILCLHLKTSANKISDKDLLLDNLYTLRNLEINISTFKGRLKRYQDYKKSEYNQRGPGENGEGVQLTKEEEKNLDEVMKVEAFNRPASDRISLQRSLPDYRGPECKAVIYPLDLPTASVVVIFHNEAWSPLLRTAHSVVNRSPPHLLKEVILLDDASYKVGLGTKLDDYIRTNWPDGVVRVVRRKERLGLIKARMEGAKVATGDVIMFLDSHCEVTHGWLEPLLFRIYEKRSTMMIPVIESIDSKNLAYYGSSELGQVGTFWWSMHFTWENIPQHFKDEVQSKSDPIKSATMAGGLFAADRKYFFEVGAYDEGMEIWGGENLEISFRVWTCGGTLESTPCSHVGHIFRASHPYTFPGNKDYHGLNSKRMADVWLDEYKRLFYMHRPELKDAKAGDVQSRIDLRKRLNCKPFRWYVQNVVPHKFIPDERVSAYGYMENRGSQMCLDLLGQNEFDRGNLQTGVYSCQNGASSQQIFSLHPVRYSLLADKALKKADQASQIRREWGCLTASKHFGPVLFLNCLDSVVDSQLWIHDKTNGNTVNLRTGQCLDATGLKNSDTILLKKCNVGNLLQSWKFQHYLDL